MRILLADSNHPVLHETLLAAGHSCDLYWDKSTGELLLMLPEYDGLVIRSRFRITSEILSTCKKLKCIARVGAGMENIDLDAAGKLGISCVSVPEGNRDAVGEHAIGMLLMLMNNLKKADAEVRKGIWLRKENRGYEINDKTIGIIGYGNMGSSFAQKLAGFGCKVLAYDKYKEVISHAHVAAATMEQIFSEADILSLHVPLTEETSYLVNSEFISAFKKPVYLINTARGKCLDTSALVDAISSGKVTGACLDVLEYESVSFEAIGTAEIPEPLKFLINSDKVILSPHIAGWTHESNYRMSRLAAEKMIEVLASKK
jgi:D-3-phosphoglycerate dehydrogenase / 2-oxoglutarate reductase